MTGASHDALNRLIAQQAGGALVFHGTVSEPASVTIQGKPVTVDTTNRFSGSVPAPSGTTTIVITATDGSGNQSTATYEVDQASGGKTFTYDANGNLTSDGTRTFEWDARNQLLAVTVGTHRSEFAYDGLQRRVRLIEKENSVVQSDTKVVWCETEICEERSADGVSVTRRAFALGEQVTGTARFFTTDHLGSVGEVTDTTSALLARYAFDPWGRRTLTAGSDITKVGFTGHTAQGPSATHLAMYRAYDPDLARWVGEDPLGFGAGSNFYAYVENRPAIAFDPFGLSPKWFPPWKTRFCNAQESATCQATCSAQGKGVESCKVSQTLRITRLTDRDGVVKVLRRWADGPMSCSCTEPKKEPSCGETCQKVLMVVGILGQIAWVCLTRTPPPVPVW